MNFHQNQHIEHNIAQIVQKGEGKSDFVFKLVSTNPNQDQNQTIQVNQKNYLELVVIQEETMDKTTCQTPNSK